MAVSAPGPSTRRLFSISLLGDLQLGRLVGEALASGALSPTGVWGSTLPLLRGSSDCVVANLECALTTHQRKWARTPKAFHFKCPPSPGIATLKAAGVNAVSLANNHALDYNAEGAEETVRALDAAGIAHAGAGAHLADAQKPGWTTAAGVSIALLSMADHPWEWAATGSEPGINLFDPFPSANALAWATAAAAKARAEGAGMIIFAAHYGGNYVLRPPQAVRAFFRALLDTSEVDLVFGHSAHVMQGVEVHNGRLIVYQSGDFVDDYAKDKEWRNDWGALFTARFETGCGRPQLVSLDAVPVVLSLAQTNVAAGAEAQRIGVRLHGLSAELGTQLAVGQGGVLRWRRQE